MKTRKDFESDCIVAFFEKYGAVQKNGDTNITVKYAGNELNEWIIRDEWADDDSYVTPEDLGINPGDYDL